jgi:hypothetical protein
VEVGHRLAGVRTVVDHQPEALAEVQLPRDGAGDDQQVAEHRFVRRRRLAHPGYHLFRYNEKVDGRLGLDVVQDDAAVVLMLDLRGNLAVDDALEDGFRHDGHRIAGRRPLQLLSA